MPNGQPSRNQAGFAPVEARFDGFALGLAGFTRPVRAAIRLQPVCLGPFCGSIGPGDDWLLFAEVEEAGRLRVEIDPCGAWAFDRVPEATLGALADCLRGEACGTP